MSARTPLTLAAVTLSAALGVLGCRVPRAYLGVAVAPPAPYVEVVPAAPGPDFVWINGYWTWGGADYVWMRGHWAPRPAPGYVWVRNGWTRVNGRYRFVPGRWANGSRRPRVRYTHPAPQIRVRPGARYHYLRPGGRGQGRGGVRVRPR